MNTPLVQKSNSLRVIDASMKCVNLERRQLFSAMSNPLVSFDPHQREFWVGENDNMYVVSRTGGITRAPMAPTTVYFGRYSNGSGPVGITITNSSDLPAFQTEWIEMGQQDAVPQILSATLVGTGTWQLGIKYRRNPTDTTQDKIGRAHV